MSVARRVRLVVAGGFALLLLGASVNLTRWPVTWFDEGSHLHVPKALVTLGAYADYSSEGLRHFGPTLGVGPTVLLPIAGSFALFGVGLLQARVVMAAFLVAYVLLSFRLARRLGGRVVGICAAALLLTSPGPAVLEYGRQVLGEVPGGAFMTAGLLAWFGAWRQPTWGRLAGAGLLLGGATITKHVYLLALAPALLASWAADALYYRRLAHRTFLVTGGVCAATFVAWQVVVLAWFGPGTLADNWRLLRETSAGAAFVFDLDTARSSALELIGARAHFGLLVPALIHTGWRATRRSRREQQWLVLWLVAVANLAWYVVASTGWARYAFIGMATAAPIVARFWRDLWRAARRDRMRATGLSVALVAWLAVAVSLPLVELTMRIAHVPPDDAATVAGWLRAHVPQETVVETWEPELGVLTDHRYHYPPPDLLVVAVAHVWRGGPSPATRYVFRQDPPPNFVVVGQFARWVSLYRDEDLLPDYRPVFQAGAYVVWSRVEVARTALPPNRP